MTPKKHEFEHDVKMDVEARVRQGVKVVLEEVLQEEMAEHLEAGYRGVEEHRGVGAQTLPHNGCPGGSRKTKPTTFQTLTS